MQDTDFTKRKDFLPNQGTRFDDLGPDSTVTEEQLNSLSMRQELNQRAGVAVFVGTTAERQEMRKVLRLWRKRRELHHDVDVWLDPSIQEGKVEVRYPT